MLARVVTAQPTVAVTPRPSPTPRASTLTRKHLMAPATLMPAQPKTTGSSPVPSVVATGVATRGVGTVEYCQASHYGYDYQGNPRGAAHKTVTHGRHLRVSYQGRSVVVVVNDSGPYVAGRCVDLAKSAFAQLAPPSRGVIGPVKVEHLNY